MVMAHFIKREVETLFIHRFSHGTMPFSFIFKNSFHYHVLCGLNFAYWLYGPWSAEGTPNIERGELFTWACIAVYTVRTNNTLFSYHIIGY